MASETIEGKTLTLKLKTTAFAVRTRAVTPGNYISKAADMLPHLLKLLAAEMPIEIRLMGVRMSNLRKIGSRSAGGITGYFKRAEPQDACEKGGGRREATSPDLAAESTQLRSCKAHGPEAPAAALQLGAPSAAWPASSLSGEDSPAKGWRNWDVLVHTQEVPDWDEGGSSLLQNQRLGGATCSGDDQQLRQQHPAAFQGTFHGHALVGPSHQPPLDNTPNSSSIHHSAYLHSEGLTHPLAACSIHAPSALCRAHANVSPQRGCAVSRAAADSPLKNIRASGACIVPGNKCLAMPCSSGCRGVPASPAAGMSESCSRTMPAGFEFCQNHSDATGAFEASCPGWLQEPAAFTGSAAAEGRTPPGTAVPAGTAADQAGGEVSNIASSKQRSIVKPRGSSHGLWVCKACTYADNPELMLRCVICETPKLGPISAPVSSAASTHQPGRKRSHSNAAAPPPHKRQQSVISMLAAKRPAHDK